MNTYLIMEVENIRLSGMGRNASHGHTADSGLRVRALCLHGDDCGNSSSSSNLSDFASLDTGGWDYSVDLGAQAARVLSDPPDTLALVLGLLAIFANILSMLSISQIRMRLTSHLRLIVSLAMSDVLIGVSVILFITNRILNIPLLPGFGPRNLRDNYRCVFLFTKAVNNTALNSTLLNLIGMALDHYLAILRPLHYPSLVNKRRTTLALVFIWTLAICGGFSDFFTALPDFKRVEKNYTYCEVVYLSPYQEEYITFATAIFGFFFMLFCYVRIYIRVRQRQREILKSENVHYTLKYNRRGLITTLLIVGTFIVCWLPMCLFQIALVIQVKIDRDSVIGLMTVFLKVDRYLYDLHLLNAICDPVIYAVRMAEVQLGYKRLVWRLCHVRLGRMSRSRLESSACRAHMTLEPKMSLMNSLSRATTNTSIRVCTSLLPGGSREEGEQQACVETHPPHHQPDSDNHADL